MKKLYSLIAMLVLIASAHAQNPFFQVVNYRGAFAPAPATPWTDGWTNWDPQNTSYGAPTVTVSTTITSNTTWTSNNVYLIQGLVYVKNGATLTIQPGTVIRGDASIPNSSLIITKGSKINAVGTSTNPIVFTSSKSEGSRAKGDWGGVIILGKGTLNRPGGTANIEGIAASTDTEFGGGTSPDNEDNSGNLKYIRIEYGGYVFNTDQEINGLTLGAVGRNTVIDFVQCSFINDDAFEWFGGTVNASHLVAYKCLDDNWDTDNGYSGSVQFCLAVRDPNISDQSSGSTSEGFESDNDAAGSSNTPQTTCVFSNVTEIGPFRGSTLSSWPTTFKFRRAARFRRNSGIKLLNSVLTDYPYGVFIDGTACRANLQSGTTVFKNNIVAGCFRASEPGTANTVLDSLYSSSKFKNDSLLNTSGILISPYDSLSPDFRPEIGSLALSNVNFTDAAFNNRKIIVSAASSIREVTYRGAFAPAPSIQWTDGWTEWDPQNKVYPAPTVTVSGTITSNTTWTSGNTYLISGLVYVASGVTLTIEAGTVIRGDATVPNSSLIITKNARLIANGTVNSPIVFTSSKTEGTRAVGDWGGVIILGRASLNRPGGVANIEGIAASTSTEFGGGATPNDDDNSGSLKYLRIEFGGYIFNTDQEINGLTLGAVGRGTTIDYVQCSFINDDAFEWFGGTVNCAHLVSYRCLDDHWDTDNGYNGSVQFCLGVRDPNISDQSSGSTSEGFESDNDAAGSSNNPQTRALFTNVTEIGPFRGTVQANNSWPSTFKFRRAARIRRNTGLRLFNSILMDYPYGVFMDGTAVRANLQSGNTRFKNNLIAGCTFATEPNTVSTVRDSIFGSGTGLFKNDSLATTSGVLVTPYNFTSPDYRPAPSSLALTGAAFTDAAFNGLIVPCDEVSTPGAIQGAANVISCTSTTDLTYSISPVVNATNYLWTVPAGVSIVSGQGTNILVVRFSTTYVSGGSITVVAKNDCGNTSAASSRVIVKTAIATPTIITGAANACLFIDDVTNYSTPVISNADSYLWTIRDTAVITSGQGTNTVEVYFPSAVSRDTIFVAAKGACFTTPTKSFPITTTRPADPSVLTGLTNVCSKFNGNAVSDTVIYRTRKLPNTSQYLWTVPANVTIVGGNGTNSFLTIDTSLTVTFNSAFVSGSISVFAVAPCGQSVRSFSLSISKIVASSPTAIQKSFDPSIPATTQVCGSPSENYLIRKVTNATGFNWSFASGSFATITRLNPVGPNDTAITVTFQPGFTRDTLRVASVTPCSISAFRTIVLTAPSAPVITATNLVTNVCGQRKVRYSVSTPVGVTGFEWSFVGNGLSSTAVIDSGTSASRVIVVRYPSNAAAAVDDSVRCQYVSNCGLSAFGRLKITLSALTVPSAPSITATTLVSNVCGGRKVRYSVATTPAATSSSGAATGYEWSLVGSGLSSTAVIDSGTTSSRVIVVLYPSNAAAAVSDSVLCRYTSDCGFSNYARFKNSLSALAAPAAPSITATTLVSNVCGGRKVRYSVATTPAATSSSGAATGYEWSLVGSGLSSTAVIDSGTTSSRVIVVLYPSNAAAAVSDSVLCRYTSDCGFSNYARFKNSLPALAAPAAPASMTITKIVDINCGRPRYRFRTDALVAATTSAGAATGWDWQFTGNLLGNSSNYIIDSGSLTSQIFTVEFQIPNAADISDSVKVRYSSLCGSGTWRPAKLTNTASAINPPAAPASLTITRIPELICGKPRYRYAAPSLSTASSTTVAGTGWQWELFGGGPLVSAFTIDSGSVNSRVITVQFESPVAATLNSDSVRVRYTSFCGNGAWRSARLTNLLTTTTTPSAPSGISSTVVDTTCGGRVIRYAVSEATSSTSALPAGYQWTFVGTSLHGSLGSTYVIDSGTVNSRVIRVRYLSSLAASANDSVRCAYISACGIGSNARLRVPITTSCTPQTTKIQSPMTSNTKIGLSDVQIQVYPNPSNSFFNLQVITAGHEPVYVRVLDVQGRFIRSFMVAPNNTHQIGDNLKQGTYLFEIKQGDIQKAIKVVKF